MSAGLQPYPAYKPSGVVWLGEVPAHWEVMRLKVCVSDVVDLTSTRRPGEIYIALENVESWTGRIVHVDLETPFESKVKRFRRNDVLFGKLRPYLAKTTCVDREGVCVGEFLVLRTCEAGPMPRYLERWLCSRHVIDAVDASTFGAKMPRADWRFIGNMDFTLPPTPEQAAIVRFLDHSNERIDRYIRAKRKLIALLEEQKQILVHDAVTGRFDVRTGRAYPAYKPSGVEWLVKVPAHWEVRHLARMGRLTKGRGGTKEDNVDLGVPCIRYGDLYTQHRFFIERATSFVSHDTAESYTPIQYGDVLFAGSGETLEDIGKSAVSLLPSPACCGGDVIIFRPSRPVNARFLGLATGCSHAANQKSCMGRGITVMHIYGDELKYLGVSLPPLPEQIAIASYLDSAIADIANTIDRTNRQICLLREYRTRLIADVVTGKLDVRKATPELPGLKPIIDRRGADTIQVDSSSKLLETTSKGGSP